MSTHRNVTRRSAVTALAAGLLSLGAAAALPATAATPPVSKPYVSPEATRDVSLEAIFTSVDASGRYRTFIQVFAADGRRIAAAPPLASRPLSIDVRVRDESTGEFVLDASGVASLEQSALQTQPRLTGATIVGSVPGVEGVSGAEVQLAANLRIEGTGDLERSSDRIIVHEDGFILNAVGQVVSRTGTATGTVTVDGRNYVNGPSLSATAVELQSGSVVVVSNK